MPIFSGKGTSYSTQYRVDVAGKQISLGQTDNLKDACDFARFVSRSEWDTIRVYQYNYSVTDRVYKLESATIHSQYINGMKVGK